MIKSIITRAGQGMVPLRVPSCIDSRTKNGRRYEVAACEVCYRRSFFRSATVANAQDHWVATWLQPLSKREFYLRQQRQRFQREAQLQDAAGDNAVRPVRP